MPQVGCAWVIGTKNVWTNVLMKKTRQGEMFRINVKEKILRFEMNRIRWAITRLRDLNLSPLPAKLVISSVFTHCTYPSTWTRSCLKITKKINHFLFTIDYTKWRDTAQTQIKRFINSCFVPGKKPKDKYLEWIFFEQPNMQTGINFCRRWGIRKTGIGRRNSQPFDKNSS